MALYGSSIQTEGGTHAQVIVTDRQGRITSASCMIPVESAEVVTLVVPPNDFAHQRHMQAINGIVPEAATVVAEPATHHATEAPMPPHLAEVLDGREDDEGALVDPAPDVSNNPDYRAGGTSSDDEVGA